MASSPDPETSAGALLFVLSPLLMAVGLRTLGREGWADAGLRLGRERGWYAVALLLFPVLFVVPVVLGALIGDVHVAPGAAERFAVLFATGLVARLTFAAFEEFGWRGYLEPRLAALGVPALRRHLAVGVAVGRVARAVHRRVRRRLHHAPPGGHHECSSTAYDSGAIQNCSNGANANGSTAPASKLSA